jgi:hypothetical protein
MGFSYTRPYDILDTGCVLLAPALSVPCLSGQVDDFMPFGRNSRQKFMLQLSSLKP